MTEEKESFDRSSDGRGFATVEQYTQHSQCAVYLAKELFEQQIRNTETIGSIYDNSWETSANDNSNAIQLIPGASLYIFSESVPVFITLRWFMQCVVLAKNSAEGGVQARFLALLNKEQITEDYVECENYKVGNKNLKVNGGAKAFVRQCGEKFRKKDRACACALFRNGQQSPTQSTVKSTSCNTRERRILGLAGCPEIGSLSLSPQAFSLLSSRAGSLLCGIQPLFPRQHGLVQNI
jgi:hypothetical protein